MKRKIRNIEEHRKAFEIEVPASDVNKRKNELFGRLSKTASVPGFRAGKAPRDLLEKHYGERVTKEAIEDLIADSYRQAVEEEGLIPLGYPHISEVKLDDQNILSFKAEFNTRPRIDIKGYKGLSLKKKKVQIGEEDVDRSISSLRESTAKFKECVGRPVQIGDYIVCDSHIFVDSKPIAKKRENIWMPIEENSYVPGVSKALIGAALNEEKEIEATLPEDFPIKEHANQKAVFKIKVKEIKEKVLPQIDDEFAKDLGYNNLAELNDSVKKVLESQAERQVRQDLERQVIEKLLEGAKFNVPATLVEGQLKYLVNEEKERLKKQGLEEEDINTKDKELHDKLRPVAQRQVKIMFVLDEIAHKEKITVSDEEIGEAFEGLSKQYNQPRGKVENYYKENDLIPNLTADIKNAKLMDLLIKEAEIEEF
jgi:trigger factor